MSTSSSIDDLVRQLPPAYANNTRLKADVKRLLGIPEGTLPQFGALPATPSRPWMLSADIAPFGGNLGLRLWGQVQLNSILIGDALRTIHKEKRVPIQMWLPPEYPGGYDFAHVSLPFCRC